MYYCVLSERRETLSQKCDEILSSAIGYRMLDENQKRGEYVKHNAILSDGKETQSSHSSHTKT